MVRATQIIEKGIYVCNFDELVLEPEACKAFSEKAEAHSNDPELEKRGYCMIFKFEGRKYEKPCRQCLIIANNESEEVGLRKPLFLW